MMKQRGLMPLVDSDIADAKQALEKLGLTHEQLLHMAAHDWVRSIRLKHLLAEAEEKAPDSPDLAQWLTSTLKNIMLELGTDIIERGKSLQRRKTASAGGKTPRKGQAQAKEAIRLEWQAWQAGDSRYHSQGAFAKKMCDKHLCIASSQTIEAWCRTWRKNNAERS